MRQLLLEHMPDEKGCIEVKGKDAKYLSSVLRLRVDDVFEARFPDGSLRSVKIISRGNNSVILKEASDIVQNSGVENGSSSLLSGGVTASSLDGCANGTCRSRIWLVQCMPKASKLDLIIRQAVEAGVERIYLVLSDRSVYEKSTPGNAKLERWSRIVKEARQQSASPVETVVMPPAELKEVMKSITCDEEGRSFANLVLTEAPLERKPMHYYLKDEPDVVVLAVGSEGGISKEELSVLKENLFYPVHFMTNVLRTETAALYGIAAAQTILTEFSSWQLKE